MLLKSRLIKILLVAGIALVSAGCLEFRVQKQVINGSPTAPYTLHALCEETGIPLPGLNTDDGFKKRFVSVNSGGSASLVLLGSGTCIFTEPESAAATVTIVCLNPGPDIVCSAAPGSLIVHARAGARVDIRVINDYTPPATPTTSPAP